MSPIIFYQWVNKFVGQTIKQALDLYGLSLYMIQPSDIIL